MKPIKLCLLLWLGFLEDNRPIFSVLRDFSTRYPEIGSKRQIVGDNIFPNGALRGKAWTNQQLGVYSVIVKVSIQHVWSAWAGYCSWPNQKQIFFFNFLLSMKNSL